jgi:drug/metabolite transporter (DMT)-like permease
MFPWLAAIGVITIWSLCSIIIESASLANHALAFGALRSLIASAALSIAALFVGRFRPPKGTILTLGLIGLTGVTVPMAGMFLSVPGAGSALAGLLGNLQALVTLPLASLLLRERLTGKQILGVLVGSLGAALLVASKGFEGAALQGAMWALASSIGNALSAVLYKRIEVSVHVLTATVWQYILGSVPLVAIIAFTDLRELGDLSSVSIGAAIFLGLIGSAGASLIWLYLLKLLPIVPLTALTLLVPALAVIWGAALFGFNFSATAVFAIALVLSGVVLAGLPRRVTATGV